MGACFEIRGKAYGGRLGPTLSVGPIIRLFEINNNKNKQTYRGEWEIRFFQFFLLFNIIVCPIINQEVIVT